MIENGILAFSRVFIIYYIKGEPHHEHRAADLTEQTPVGLYTSIYYIDIYGVFETRRWKTGKVTYHFSNHNRITFPSSLQYEIQITLCVRYTHYYSTIPLLV